MNGAIDIYILTRCSKCRSTKAALTTKGQIEGKDRVEHDLSLPENEDARRWVMEDLGYQEAPIVVVNEENHWSGFRPDKILALKGKELGS